MVPPEEEPVQQHQGNHRHHNFLGVVEKLNLSQILLSLVVICLYSVVRFTNVFIQRTDAITRYCNWSEYKIEIIPNPNYFAGFSTVAATFVVCAISICISCRYAKYTWNKMLSILMSQIWILAMYLIFLVVTVDLVRDMAGLPYHDYFDPSIYEFYCPDTRTQQDLLRVLIELDTKVRKYFPSCFSAIYGFCITFGYIYIDRFPVVIGLRPCNRVVTAVLTSWVLYDQFYMWKHRGNKLIGILAGATLGIIYAIMAVRNMFRRP